MQTFYKRLTQLIEKKGFKSLNDFALNGLKYDSSSKLSRLKDENKKPSFEILEDIANKFEDLNLRWLILGKEEMIKGIEISNEITNDLEEKLKLLEEQNDLLKENLNLYKDRCEIYKSEIAELKGTSPDRSQTA